MNELKSANTFSISAEIADIIKLNREGELINRSAAEGEDDAPRLIMHEGAEIGVDWTDEGRLTKPII